MLVTPSVQRERTVFIGGVERTAHFFAFDLPHSDACFVRAYPAATAEAWVDGHVHAFAFFGRVPQSVLYDNDRCLVARILRDGTRKRATLFSGFLSHYLIRDRYGRPGKGNDKGAVEGLVGWARRTFMVPLPRFASWEDFNAWLEAQCRKRQVEILRGHAETIGARLARDLAAMADLPAATLTPQDLAVTAKRALAHASYLGSARAKARSSEHQLKMPKWQTLAPPPWLVFPPPLTPEQSEAIGCPGIHDRIRSERMIGSDRNARSDRPGMRTT